MTGLLLAAAGLARSNYHRFLADHDAKKKEEIMRKRKAEEMEEVNNLQKHSRQLDSDAKMLKTQANELCDKAVYSKSKEIKSMLLQVMH